MTTKQTIAMIVAGGNSTRNSKYTGNYIPKALLCISKNGIKAPAITHTINSIKGQYSKIYIAVRTSDYDLFDGVLIQYGLDSVVKLIRIHPIYNSKGSLLAIYSALENLTESESIDETVSMTFIWSDLLINAALPTDVFNSNSTCIGVVSASTKLCRYELKNNKIELTNTKNPTNNQIVGIYHFTKFKPYRFVDAVVHIKNGIIDKEMDFVDMIRDDLFVQPTSVNVGKYIVDFGSAYEYEKACLESNIINGRGDCAIELTEDTCKKHLSDRYDVVALQSWLNRHSNVSPTNSLQKLNDGSFVLEMERVDSFLIDDINNSESDQEVLMLINTVLDQLKLLHREEDDLVQFGVTASGLLTNVLKETHAKVTGRYTKNIQYVIHSLGFDVDKLIRRSTVLAECIFKHYVYNISNVKIVPIHGDPNFGNLYLDGTTLKYIDPRHGFGTFIGNGPAEYDRSKVLYAALGYDNFNQQYPHVPGSTFKPVIEGLLDTGCGVQFSKIEKLWALFHMYMLIPLQYYDLVKMSDTIFTAEKAYLSGKF
jgi:hypothetical protein